MRDSLWLSLISILILLPRVISELLFRFSGLRYVWVFRIIDIFDLTLQTLSFIVLVYYLFDKYIYSEADKKVMFIFIVLSMFLLGGHLMHSAANAIDMSYRETVFIDPEENMPKVTYTLLHFLDEYLSHAIMYLSLYGLLFMGALIDLKSEKEKISQKDLILITLWGFILGGSLGISIIEASIALLMIPTILALLLVLIYKSKEHNIDPKRRPSKPLFLFVMTVFLWTLIAMFIYIAIFGFYSPRELIGSYLKKS